MPSRLTRRRFLAASATVAATPYVKAFAPGEPKEKVRLAVVGVANRGGANLKGVEAENIVALCDVDPEHAAKARGQFPSAQYFTDYRKMFDAVANKVDAVVDIPNSGIAIAVHNMVRERNKIALLSGPGASSLTDELCSPNTVHFAYDTYALSKVTAAAVVELPAGEGVVTTTISAAALAAHREKFPAMLDADRFELR